MKSTKTYSPHYEVYFKLANMGWFMGGYRDDKDEAEAYGKREVAVEGSNIVDYKLKKKNYVDPIKI